MISLQKSIVAVYVITVFLLISVKCQEKSTLAFVIDDTASMGEDIHHVKDGTNAIMDIILNKKSSQIENMVLVTFNDPAVKLLENTNDRNKIKEALSQIVVNGGDDCPEYSLTGIKVGLEQVHPESYLYVFTDDSAKEGIEMAGLVKRLAQNKQCQVVFIITPNSFCRTSGKNFDKYYDIAAGTNGQVFRLTDKSEVSVVLKYVEETISGQRTVLASKVIPPNEWHDIPFVIDKKSQHAVISTSGEDVNLVMVDTSVAKQEKITWLNNIKILKIIEPGSYLAHVKGSGTTSVIVFARTDFTFQYGFSEFRPKSLNDTTKQPLKDTLSYLSIQLTKKVGGVKLSAIELLDMDDKVVIHKSLELVDEDDKFYTTLPLISPNYMFKVSVIGIDLENNETITRISNTPVEPQRVEPLIPIVNEKPVVTIDGEPKINAEYGMPFQLKCKVHAYPKPDVSWRDMETGTLLPSILYTKNLPYEYTVVLELENVIQNRSYECSATNSQGSNSKSVTIETIRKTYFNVLESPKDTKIEYKKEGKLTCKIDSFPLAEVSWYINGKNLSNSTNIEILENGAVVKIKEMQPGLNGTYLCEARNEFDRKLLYSDVLIVGYDRPKLDKNITLVEAIQGTNTSIACRLTVNEPKSTIRWFFRHKFGKYFIEFNWKGEELVLSKVNEKYVGVYKCEATNEAGTDSHNVELIVKYPPIIKKGVKYLSVQEGSTAELTCEVSAVPTPKVTWFLNDKDISNDSHFHNYRDHSLRFKATLKDEGNYTCYAVNAIGYKRKTVSVQVYVPVAIEPPPSTKMEVMTHNILVLPCKADGYPAPKITWNYFSKEPSSELKLLPPISKDNSLVIEDVQINDGGFYTCVASNIGKAINMTYEITVLDPPEISDEYPSSVTAILDDFLAKIHCKATGAPTPVITWTKDGFLIASGTEWYHIEEDGTLIIKNIGKNSGGDYECEARNSIGFDSEVYKLIVEDYPKDANVSSTAFIEEGKSGSVVCNLPHTKRDRLRWFKENRMISSNELELINAAVSDAGIYTCRVSNFSGAWSDATEVQIVRKPRFIKEAEENIDYNKDAVISLDCDAEGIPTPTITWWHNGEKLNFTETSYELIMNIHNRGQYTCDVRNAHGDIQRKFFIESKDCLLNTKTDFNGNSPVMVLPDFSWPTFEIIEEHLRIPTDDIILLHCSEGFSIVNKTLAFLKCDRGTTFLSDGETVKFTDFKCTKQEKPLISRTGISCLNKWSEYMKVGYIVEGHPLDVYEVCIDTFSRVSLFTKHTIDHNLMTNEEESKEWFTEATVLPFNYNEIYNCDNQIRSITWMLGKWSNREDGCCFRKRQLVNPRDLGVGIPKSIAYSYFNVVPQWSTCNSKNWDDIENRVQLLAQSSGQTLDVWTGTAHSLYLPDQTGQLVKISIKDPVNHKYPVSRYLWKIIRDPLTQASVAIIQVNEPDFTLKNAFASILCSDICKQLKWMAGTKWRDVNNGYTYCCKTQNFMKVFGLTSLFDSELDSVLEDISLLPDSSLII